MDKIYTERKILVGVLIGGALAGGYLFWRTFKSLGESTKAKAAIIVTGIVALVSFGLIFTIESIPTLLFPAVHLGITTGVLRAYLSEPIHAYLAASKPVYGWANTMLVSIVSLAITVAILATPILLYPSSRAPAAKQYGSLRHEVQYDPSNISEPEVDRLANALTMSGFFDDVQQKTIDASRSGERYVLTFYCNETIRTDPEAIAPFAGLRNDMQQSFPDDPLIFDLVIGTPENLVKRLE
jgi:hypothetical protein